jgi:hypothetical protein
MKSVKDNAGSYEAHFAAQVATSNLTAPNATIQIADQAARSAVREQTGVVIDDAEAAALQRRVLGDDWQNLPRLTLASRSVDFLREYFGGEDPRERASMLYASMATVLERASELIQREQRTVTLHQRLEQVNGDFYRIVTGAGRGGLSIRDTRGLVELAAHFEGATAVHKGLIARFAAEVSRDAMVGSGIFDDLADYARRMPQAVREQSDALYEILHASAPYGRIVDFRGHAEVEALIDARPEAERGPIRDALSTLTGQYIHILDHQWARTVTPRIR